MGFKPAIHHLAFAFVLLTSPTAVIAAGEPLVVTNLPEPRLQVVSMDDPEGGAEDQAMQRFAAALSQAATAEQQSLAARCKSSDPVPPAGADRLQWEANCRYRRR